MTGSPSDANSTWKRRLAKGERLFYRLELGRGRKVAEAKAGKLIGRGAWPCVHGNSAANWGNDDFAAP